jgi:hypothetical protein
MRLFGFIGFTFVSLLFWTAILFAVGTAVTGHEEYVRVLADMLGMRGT